VLIADNWNKVKVSDFGMEISMKIHTQGYPIFKTTSKIALLLVPCNGGEEISHFLIFSAPEARAKNYSTKQDIYR
jgi:hypothetical protein